VSVTIKRSAEGSVVVVRGWSFVTSSSLMPAVSAERLAWKLAGHGGKVRRRAA